MIKTRNDHLNAIIMDFKIWADFVTELPNGKSVSLTSELKCIIIRHIFKNPTLSFHNILPELIVI